MNNIQRMVLPLLLLMAPLFSISQESNATFYVRNYTDQNVGITRINNFLKGAYPYIVEADSSILYQYQQPLLSNQFVSFKFNKGRNERIYFIHKGDTLSIRMKNKIPVATAGSESRDMELAFMNKLYEQVEESNFFDIKTLPYNGTLQDRDNYFKSVYKKQNRFLDENASAFQLSEDFQKQFRLLMLSKLIKNQFTVQVRANYKGKMSNYYKNQFTTYIDSFDRKTLYGAYHYREAAVVLSQCLSPTPRTYYNNTKELFKDSPLRDFLLSKYIYDLINANDTTIRRYMADYEATCTDTVFKNEVLTLYALKAKGAEVALKDEVYLLTAAGEKTTFNEVLKANKGNVIYLDFWATWCAPCKEEMPYSEKLREKFKDKKVTFLFLSTDEDYSIWKEDAITKSHIGKTPSFVMDAPDDNKLSRTLKISAIPRYVIIDKNGLFYDLNAPRPSNPATVDVINKLLRE